jgi:ribosomal protein L30E
MCIALIGGMDRLGKHYHDEAGRAGVELQVFTKSENNIGGKLKKADAVVIFTNMVSHRIKKEAMNAAKINNIPVFMHHSCGVCTLRECLNCLLIIHNGAGAKAC